MLGTRNEKLYIDEAQNLSIKESLEENSPTNSYMMTKRMEDDNNHESTTSLNQNSSTKGLSKHSPTPNRLNVIQPGRIINQRSPQQKLNINRNRDQIQL